MASSTPISLVVAVADNGVIGLDGRLAWHLPDDLRHFKAVTMGKAILMGRRTFQSIGRPLPGRRTLILSRGSEPAIAGVETVRSLEQARELIGEATELCVIGGAAVYALTLPLAVRVYLTEVHGSPVGDTFFPLSELRGWHELERSEHAADERHHYAMSFVTLTRQPGAESVPNKGID